MSIKTRLEYLRRELRGERISQGELVELQDLAEHIHPNDVELLEAAGVPETGSRVERSEPADPLGLVTVGERGVVLAHVQDDNGLLRCRVEWEKAGVLDSLPGYLTALGFWDE